MESPPRTREVISIEEETLALYKGGYTHPEAHDTFHGH
jgi:hypothetical protein